jgi:ATP-dependent helicase/DNAse subunit B
MLELLSARAAKLSPSSIETFLQCPFRFFAQKTLRLQERPAEPRDRLNVMVQGSILHDALAARIDTPLIDFDQVFDAMCREKRIPFTYRTEAVRLELRRYFEAFIQSPALDLKGWSVRTELSFESVLRPGFLIRGRIDRLEQSAKGEALVIDYKYSAASRIKDRVEESGTGDKVQAGLYLAAAEKAFHLKPAGMLFCGLKKEITWAGWHTNIPGLQQIGTAVTPQFLQDIAKSALDAAEVAHQAIVSGRVSPAPSDPDTCRWCDYRDVCRVESIAVQSKAGGA